MDGEAGWWTTCGNIGLPPLARVMGVGRQQQQQHGSVTTFCYLGATFDGNGADLAATYRIRNGWMKFRELLPFLTSRAHRLEMKAQVYAYCLRSSMTYGSETRPFLVDVGLKFEIADMQMDVWCFHERQKDK